ncbi:DUF3857 domain-containing protein [Desertivirga brevis]|uniref:DUF3857 domain-containing protein n=1 Tax=Desertivirga brevis TaxID=2810310 RepID=UPI001A95B9FD|nr:DUF3857 domain-containing protein [Pedobacter sp. SYSU D00873]
MNFVFSAPASASRSLKALLISFSIIAISAFASNAAQIPKIFSSANPTWINPILESAQRVNSREVSEGYYFTLVDMQEHVEKEVSYLHYCKQIISESGVQNASQISVDFDPSFQKLEFHKIIIWRNGKPSNRLNLKAFKVIANEEDLSRFIYQGTYSAYLILDDIRKGDKIEYSYSITGRNPIFKGKFSKELYLQGYTAINKAYLSVVCSSSRNLNFKYFNKVHSPKIESFNGMKRYTWEALMVKAAIQEENQPSWYNDFKRVQISDYQNWKEVAIWANELNKPITSFSGALASRVQALKKKNVGNLSGYFRDAVTLVQDEVRYMGVEMGVYSHKAHNPQKVFDQRYGDCKDKSLLLMSILEFGGIKANMALINTYYQDKVASYLPSPLNFNHAVVIAYVGGKQIWVDPTISGQGGKGTDLWFPNYRMALIVSPGSNTLSTIPEVAAGFSTMRETFTVDSATMGATLYVKTKYTGNMAESVRSSLANQSITEAEKSYLDYYARLYKEIEAVDTVKINDNRGKNELEIEEFYKIDNFLKREKDKSGCKGEFYAYQIENVLPKVAATRKSPAYLNYQYSISYTASIVLPGGWRIEPENKEISRSQYRLYYRTFTVGDTLNLDYQYSLTADHIPTSDVKQVVKDVEDIDNNYLGFSFTYNPDATKAGGGTNYPMLLFALFILASGVYAIIRIATMHTATEMPEYEPAGIGGWLIFLAFSLLATVIRPLYFVISQEYFSSNLWAAYDGRQMVTAFKILLVFEVAGNILLSLGAAFCLFLMYKKRDIFPKVTGAVLGFSLIFALADTFLASVFLNIKDTTDANTVRGIIGSFVWIAYLSRSSRVKETFIIPYPEEYFEVQEEVEKKDEEIGV